MSKVDLNVFQEFAEKYFEDNELCDRFFYELFSGNLDSFDLPSAWGSAEDKAARKAIFDQYGYAFMEGDTGGEGEGEYCYGVIRFQGKFYQAEWSYYSYNGCEYDGICDTIKEVVPKQVMVTQYVSVDKA